MGYNFNLEQSEAELLMNALQRQTNNLLEKIQVQFNEQIKNKQKAQQPEEQEDELITEETSERV